MVCCFMEDDASGEETPKNSFVCQRTGIEFWLARHEDSSVCGTEGGIFLWLGFVKSNIKYLQWVETYLDYP